MTTGDYECETAQKRKEDGRKTHAVQRQHRRKTSRSRIHRQKLRGHTNKQRFNTQTNRKKVDEEQKKMSWTRHSHEHKLAAQGISTGRHKQPMKIRLVNKRVLKDYAGMNPMAARALGYKNIRKNEILVASDTTESQRHTIINHEVDEMQHMEKGDDYWTAHKKALKSEKQKR